jgi:predicted PurR-regulated permease PerM
MQRPVAGWHPSQFVIRLALAVVLLLVLWQLGGVLLLAFAAVFVALGLKSLADPIARHTPLGDGSSLAVAILVLVAFVGAFFVLLGAQIAGQLRELAEQIPDLLASLGERLGIADFEETVAERLRHFLASDSTVFNIAGMTLTVLDVAATIGLVFAAGVFIAARPRTYRHGFLLLWPKRMRTEITETVDAGGTALRYWLIAQLTAMAIVGTMSTIGLTLLGVPSALALGFIAAVTDFVPIVGPIFGAVPAVLIAFSISPTLALWVIGLYAVIQLLEGNVVQPLVQSQAVDLPPAITLFALVAAGVLFGPLGVVLATPLAVITLVAVKILYVRHTLDEKVEVPGED